MSKFLDKTGVKALLQKVIKYLNGTLIASDNTYFPTLCDPVNIQINFDPTSVGQWESIYEVPYEDRDKYKWITSISLPVMHGSCITVAEAVCTYDLLLVDPNDDTFLGRLFETSSKFHIDTNLYIVQIAVLGDSLVPEDIVGQTVNLSNLTTNNSQSRATAEPTPPTSPSGIFIWVRFKPA